MQAALRRRARRSAVEPPIPVVPPTSEWDEAFSRVESYLRAHQVESRVLLNQLATEILADARTLALEHPDERPVTLAMQITHARIGEWLVHALGEGDWADEHFRARGRLAVLMADVPRRCPEQFLSHERLPNDVERGLASAQLRPGPEVKLARMPSWLVLIGVLGVAWFLTR